MRKNKKIVYAAVSGCVILAGASVAVTMNAGHPQASEVGSGTDTKNTPPSGEMPPEPPSGSGAPPRWNTAKWYAARRWTGSTGWNVK